MPDRKPGESKQEYMERCVPMLIKEGKSPDQAVAICASMAKSAEANLLEFTKKVNIELTAMVVEDGLMVLVEGEEETPDTYRMATFNEIFAMLGCENGKHYEIEISVKEEE